MATIYPSNLPTTIQPGRQWQFNETNTFTITETGNYNTLKNYRVGQRYGAEGSNTYIRTVQVTKEEGGVGVAVLTLVECDADGVYSETIEVEMKEVQKSLKTHPSLTAAALKEIRLWEATPEAKRIFYGGGGSVAYRYYDLTDDDPEVEPPLVTVADEDAIKYMNAVTSGIETYNVYLPVISKTTNYVFLPSSDSVISYSGNIGKYVSTSDLPIQLSGYNSETAGFWFKNEDKYTRAADGSWTRSEQWTFTNDKSHGWIYEKGS